MNFLGKRFAHIQPVGMETLTSASTLRVQKRKRFRQLEINKVFTHKKTNRVKGSSTGSFEKIGDDVLLLVMHLIVRIPRDVGRGLGLEAFVTQSSVSLYALVRSCSRMTNILSTIGVALHREMAARAATQIIPVDLYVSYPFTAQVRRESVSSDQLTVLREAISGMHAHCAGPCCSGRRNEFNRGHKEPRLLPAARRSTLTAACPSGEVAFVATRERNQPELKARHRGGVEGSSTSQFILQLSCASSKSSVHAKTATTEMARVQLMDMSQFSAPHFMRSCSEGRRVAFVRAVHSGAPDSSIPHSVVSVWDTRLSDGLSQVLEPPGHAEQLGAINAQECWWRTSGAGEVGLAVLWSTAYVHPMGSIVGANADNACYFLAVYSPAEKCAMSLEQYVGPFFGKAQTASPTASGCDVAVLVRKPPMGNGLPRRCTMLHNMDAEEAAEATHSYDRACTMPAHPLDAAICPSAVSLSPSGDCLVAVHRRRFTVLVEVLVSTAPGVFVTVQNIDVTHWLSSGQQEDDSPFDEEPEHALRLPFEITFSPCGRFATVVDRKTLFGMTATNYSLVVLDLCQRLMRRGVRALPLAQVDDVAPRTLEWTPCGLWMQPRYGCIFLRA